jgi:hypothetical protein
MDITSKILLIFVFVIFDEKKIISLSVLRLISGLCLYQV